MLRIRQVIEENQDQEHVRPPEHALSVERGARREIVKRRRERARDELLRTNGFRLQDRQECIREEQRHHQAGDQAEDDVRVEVLDAVTLESLRMQYEAPIERKRDGGEHEDREGVLRERVQCIERMPEHGLIREAAPHALDEDLDRARGEHDETPEDRGVHDAGNRFAQNLRLRDANLQHVRKPPPGMVRAVLGKTETEVAHEPLNVQREDAGSNGEDDEEKDVLRGHAMRPGVSGPSSPRARLA